MDVSSCLGWTLSYVIATIATHSLNIYRVRSLAYDAISSKRPVKRCFIDFHGFSVFYSGLFTHIVAAIPIGLIISFFFNIWDITVPITAKDLLKGVILGLTGFLRTPGENVLFAMQCKKTVPLKSLFRGAYLTTLRDVIFWVSFVFLVLLFDNMDGYKSNSSREGEVISLSILWNAVPRLMSLLVVTVLTNPLDVIRGRIMSSFYTEVFDLTELTEGSNQKGRDESLIKLLGKELKVELQSWLHNIAIFFDLKNDQIMTPLERSTKPCALWQGMIPRVLQVCLLFLVTVVWGLFILK